MFLPYPRVTISIVGSLRDREVACSASDRQGSTFESCVWRTVPSESSHHPQEVLLALFSLYAHKGERVTEAPHNTDFYTWMGKKHFCFFQTAETGNRTPNSGVKGSGANRFLVENIIWIRLRSAIEKQVTDYRGKCPNMSTLRKTATSNFIILSGHFKLMYIISYAYSQTETVFLSWFHAKINI